VNEYTRREEVRWTLIASLLMVLFIAPAVVLLVTAKGKPVPDPAARALAEDAETRIKPAHQCVVAADKLGEELIAFKASAKAAHVDAPADDAAGAAAPGAPGPPRPHPGRSPRESRPAPDPPRPATTAAGRGRTASP